jgi:RNA polymerase sigma-70 factor (ECF subfamily)
MRRDLSRWDVEDITQQVLSLLYANDQRALDSFRPELGVPFASYVGLIAQRAAISTLRKRQHFPRAERAFDPLLLDRCAAEGPNLEDDLAERGYNSECVRRLESTLSARGRSVLRALYRDGLSVEDASVELGMSMDALYTWRHRIREKARQLIQKK